MRQDTKEKFVAALRANMMVERDAFPYKGQQ